MFPFRKRTHISIQNYISSMIHENACESIWPLNRLVVSPISLKYVFIEVKWLGIGTFLLKSSDLALEIQSRVCKLEGKNVTMGTFMDVFHYCVHRLVWYNVRCTRSCYVMHVFCRCWSQDMKVCYVVCSKPEVCKTTCMYLLFWVIV